MDAEARPPVASERVSPTGAGRLVSSPEPLRDETDHERLDRNLVELLQEVRVVQTGVQVLFAFLLTVPFSSRFDQITSFQRGVYLAALVASAAASVLLIAPTAVHRILFRLGQKEYMVDVSSRLALGGLVATAVAMTAGVLLAADVMFGSGVGITIAVATAIAFVVVWAALPLRRRREVIGTRRRDAGRT
jgi:uncharacterized protein DUF6328